MDDPPTLDRDGGKYHYSRAMKEMIDSCLQKDPLKRCVPRLLLSLPVDLMLMSDIDRPTADKLLQHPFFRGAKKKSFLVSALLEDLPPLQDRQHRRAFVPCPAPRPCALTDVSPAGRKGSLAAIDTVGSLWNFQSTVHSNSTTPRSPLRSGSTDSSVADPFASFSLAPSPVHTLAHRRSSVDQRAPLQSVVANGRTREASRSSSHRRQVSFDGEGGREGGAQPAGGFALSGSVHFEEEADDLLQRREEAEGEGGK